MRKPSSYGQYKAGLYHELIEDVGPIPRGVYRIIKCDSESVLFRAGRKVNFVVANGWEPMVRPVDQRESAERRTSQEEFLDRYYTLLEIYRLKAEPFSPNKPITMCFIDPSVMREV